MSRTDPFRRPLDATLLALRERGPDAYRCTPDPTRWRAGCPACGGHMALELREPFVGADVTATCAAGCHPERIAEALASALDDRDATIVRLQDHATALLRLVDGLRDLAFAPCPFCEDGQVAA